MIRYLPSIAILASSASQAADFGCHVTPATAQCTIDGGCTGLASNDTGTFMDLSLDGRTLSLCQGEGCSEGPVLMRREQSGFVFLFARVKSNGAEPRTTDISVLFDRRSRTAHVVHDGANWMFACAKD